MVVQSSTNGYKGCSNLCCLHNRQILKDWREWTARERKSCLQFQQTRHRYWWQTWCWIWLSQQQLRDQCHPNKHTHTHMQLYIIYVWCQPAMAPVDMSVVIPSPVGRWYCDTCSQLTWKSHSHTPYTWWHTPYTWWHTPYTWWHTLTSRQTSCQNNPKSKVCQPATLLVDIRVASSSVVFMIHAASWCETYTYTHTRCM